MYTVHDLELRFQRQSWGLFWSADYLVVGQAKAFFLIGAVAGSSAVFTVAVGMALAAAFLNAAFNYCLGCEMYLLGLRFTSK